MGERIIQCGELYRHFKGNLYQIVGVAKHSETMEEMIVYQALYGDYGLYVRPKEMFLSEVDHDKYPQIKDKYRFTKVERSSEKTENMCDVLQSAKADSKDKQLADSVDPLTADTIAVVDGEHPEACLVNENLMAFLDAKDYSEKLEVLYSIHRAIDDRLMSDIELSLDMPMGMGNLEERLDRIKDNLQTLAKFECNRLR